jgi:hypothetical protein
MLFHLIIGHKNTVVVYGENLTVATKPEYHSFNIYLHHIIK